MITFSNVIYIYFQDNGLFLIFYTETPINTLPKVQGVTVTRGVSDGSPSLTVTWTAVPEFGITYTVWYSTNTIIKQSGASTVKGITGISTTLSGLTQGTMYYIWIAAVSSGGQGPYSTRVSQTTFSGIIYILCYTWCTL